MTQVRGCSGGGTPAGGSSSVFRDDGRLKHKRDFIEADLSSREEPR